MLRHSALPCFQAASRFSPTWRRDMFCCLFLLPSFRRNILTPSSGLVSVTVRKITSDIFPTVRPSDRSKRSFVSSCFLLLSTCTHSSCATGSVCAVQLRDICAIYSFPVSVFVVFRSYSPGTGRINPAGAAHSLAVDASCSPQSVIHRAPAAAVVIQATVGTCLPSPAG